MVRVRVLALGSPHGDDQVGLRAAAALAPRPGLEVRRLGPPGPELVTWLAGAKGVVLVDAVRGAGPPGTLVRLEGEALLAAPPTRPLSGHAWDLGQVLALARTLDLLPPRVVFLGLEIGTAAPGADLSPAVARALPRLVQALEAEVEALLGPSG